MVFSPWKNHTNVFGDWTGFMKRLEGLIVERAWEVRRMQEKQGIPSKPLGPE